MSENTCGGTIRIPDWRSSRVVVLGDLILDRFVYGHVHRISPEAPIPVVEVTDELVLPGGAANVARNVCALGGRVALLGVTGDDENGATLRRVVEADGVDAGGIERVAERPTTVKTRIVAHRQQVVRVDRESKDHVPAEARSRLLATLQPLLDDCGALVVSDYAKGVLAPDFLADIGRAARRAGVAYVVDPKPVHFPYPGATVVTPNRDEAAGFFRRPFTIGELGRLAPELMAGTDWRAILFTLGPDGMVLAERDAELERIPARVREVFDVTGAGDTVVAALSLALAAGAPLRTASALANLAAGVVVGKVGTAVCSSEELEVALAEGGHGP